MPQLGQQLFCSMVVFVALYLLSYFSVIATDTGVIVLFVGLSFALAAVLFVRARQKRALLLLAYLRSSSPLSRFLQGGVLLFLLQLLLAMPMAASLLMVLSQGLATQAWLLLLAALLAWLLLKQQLERAVSQHLTSKAQNYFLLHTSMALGMVLALLLLLPLAFWQNMPDLSALAWHEVFSYAQSTVLARSELLKSSVSFWQGVDFLRIWLAQQLSLGQGDYWLKALVWALVLLQGVLFILPVILLLQGASMVADKITQRQAKDKKQQRIWAGISLVIIAVVLWQQWAAESWQLITGKQVYIVLDKQVYQVPAKALDKELQQVLDSLDAPRQAMYQQLEGQMHQKVESLFSTAEKRIPVYLDWHYSLQGLGQRLWLAVLSEQTENPANRILFASEGLHKQIAANDQWLLEQYRQSEQLLNHAMIERLKTVFADKQAHPHKRVTKQSPIDIQQMYQEHIAEQIQGRQAAMQASSAMVLAGASMTFARTLAGQSAKSLAAKGASRTATRTSPLACVITGPWFSACTVLTFIASSVAIEKGLLMVDEAQNREALEEDLKKDLQTMQQQLNQVYREQLLQLLKDNSESIRLRVKSEVKAAEYL